LACLATHASAGYRPIRIAGTEDGINVFELNFAGDRSIGLTNAGTVAFRATLPGGRSAIMLGAGGALTTLVNSDDPQFENFSDPAINNSGLVAFQARLDDDDEGLFTIDATSGVRTTRLLKSTSFLRGVQRGFSINDSGWIAAMGQADAGTFGGSNLIFASSPGGTLSVLADSTGTFSTQFREFVSINNSGSVTFQARLDNPPPPPVQSGPLGIFATSVVGGTPQTVALAGSGTFDSFSFAENAAITNDGTVVFKAGASFADSVWTWVPGGEPEQLIFAGFDIDNFGERVSVNNLGTVAFFANASGSNTRGVYTGQTHRDRVIQIGDPFAGSIITNVGMANDNINDSGAVALHYELANGRSGILRADPTDSLRWDFFSGPWNNTSTTFRRDSDNQFVAFSSGDLVRFPELDSDITVTIQPAGVAPGGNVLFENAFSTYTITGGPITGPAGIAKFDAGTLILASPNTFTGGVGITGGTLLTSAQGATGSGPVALFDSTWAVTTTSQTVGTLMFFGTPVIRVEGGISLTALNDVQNDEQGFFKEGNGTFIVSRLRNNGTLYLDDGTVQIAPSGSADSMSILGNIESPGGPSSPSGALDLNDNDAIFRYGATLPEISAFIAHARNGGAWDQWGITSSVARNDPDGVTTLGAMRGSQYRALYGNSAPFNGEPVLNSDVLVKFTYNGDTDFNGSIDFDDYARIDAAFLGTGIGTWINGDSDYSGFIDFDDYALIDAAFLLQGGPLDAGVAGRSGSQTAGGIAPGMSAMDVYHLHASMFGEAYSNAFWSLVPEPSALSILTLVGLLIRRARVQ
jgi:autotransporter-associated beta strand protein